MRTPRRREIGLSLLLLVVLAGPGPVALPGQPLRAAAEQPSESRIVVTVERGLVSLEVRDVPLSDVLRAVGERAGVGVVVVDDVKTRVTQMLDRVPVGEAMARLARGHQVVLVYGAAGGSRLTEIRIYSASSSRAATAAEDERPRTPQDGGLARALERPERDIRLRGVQALERKGTSGVEKLAELLRADSDAIVRARAATSLGKIGGREAAMALTRGLRDDSPLVRIEAVRALGAAEGERAVAALGEVLMRDRDPQVRRWAAQVVAGFSGDQARAVLSEAARDPDESVRRAAGAGLAGRGERPSRR